jgi:hypothetical protein
MGGASKGASICATLILMIMSLQIWNRLVNTAEYQLQQLFGNIFAFLQGSTPLDEPMLITIIIIVLGVVAIIGAARG